MPLRPDLISRRWSSLELHILPFLAPRVFLPWPSKGRRNYTASQDDQRNDKKDEIAETTPPSLDQENEETASSIWRWERRSRGHKKEGLSIESRSTNETAHSLPTSTQKPEHGEEQSVTHSPQSWWTAIDLPGHQSSIPDWTPGSILASKVFPSIQNFGWGDRRDKLRGRLRLQQRTRSDSKKISRTKVKGLRKIPWDGDWDPRKPTRLRPTSTYFKSAIDTRLSRSYGRIMNLKTYQRDGPQDPSPTIRKLVDWEFGGETPFKSLRQRQRDPDMEPSESTSGNYDRFYQEWLEKLINQSTSILLQEQWDKYTDRKKSLAWPELMMLTLRKYPDKALKVLAGTYAKPYPPPSSVASSLDCIIWHYLHDGEPSEDGPSAYLSKTITELLLKGPANYAYLSQHSIYLLLDHLSKPHDVAELYRALENLNNPLSENTLAHFASRLAKADPEFEELSFEILQKIGDSGADLSSPMMMSVCTTILLMTSHDAKIGYSEKFEYMLKCGLIPNIITYNTLLMKTLKSGDHSGAWRIYEMMDENGPKPDAYTLSILLNDAKWRMDSQAIQRVLAAVHERGIHHSYIVADALHSTLLFATRQMREEYYRAQRESRAPRKRNRSVFEEMLLRYCEYFNFAPLARLLPGLADRYPQFANFENSSVEKDDELDLTRHPIIDPPAQILTLMITALLRDYEDDNTPKWFYDHWRKLVDEQDPLVLSIAEHKGGMYFAHIYNCIMMSLGRQAINLPLCLKILGEMSGPKSKHVVIPANNNVPENLLLKENKIDAFGPLHPPKPTLGTWSILVQIFMNHRQPRAAEKVISMMKERGMQPNHVTWGSLLQGYSRLQDTDMVVETVDRKERMGYRTDSATFWSLKRIENRSALMEGLRKKEMERMEHEMKERDERARQPVIVQVTEEGKTEPFIVVDYKPEAAPAFKGEVENEVVNTESSEVET